MRKSPSTGTTKASGQSFLKRKICLCFKNSLNVALIALGVREAGEAINAPEPTDPGGCVLEIPLFSQERGAVGTLEGSCATVQLLPRCHIMQGTAHFRAPQLVPLSTQISWIWPRNERMSLELCVLNFYPCCDCPLQKAECLPQFLHHVYRMKIIYT